MNYILNILLWFFIGANLLNIIVVVFSRTGIIYSKYNEKGELKKKVPLRGILSSFLMLLVIFLFFIIFDYFTFGRADSLNFISVLLVNFTLLLLVDLYDAFFIDLFVIGFWKPKFLKLRDYYTMDSMKTHVKKQFTIAWIIKVPVVLICSSAFYVVSR
ncbi:MAG: hypothetical protein PVI26_13230 [Chitinispirillia bacterium]